jgi:GT2 family glycosyltransferase
MQLDPRITTQDDISGWVLVESRLGRHRPRDTSRLLVQRQTGDAEEILLPVSLHGRIHELVRLPDDVSRLVWQPPEECRVDETRLTIRRVGWLERSLRMANRVWRNWVRLTGDERSASGLTLRRALVDLSGAYDIATRFRGYLPYADWIKRFDLLRDDDCRAICGQIERMAGSPHFHLLLAADGRARQAVQATLASLREQLYRNFTCSVLDVAGGAGAIDPGAGLRDDGLDVPIVAQDSLNDWLNGFNAALADQQAGTWVMLLRAGDALPAHALYWFACEILAQPDAAIVYSDDDALNSQGGRCCPRFKPDWSLTHLRATHYLGEAVILRGGAVAAAGGVRRDCCRHGVYDLLLRVVDGAGEQVRHLPAVLLHRRHPLPPSRSEEDETAWSQNALRAHLARNGVDAEVSETLPGCRRIRYRLPQMPPLVSIIVPTRDAFPLVSRCVESLLYKTTYPRFEVLVVNNQSTDPQTLAYLGKITAHPAVTVLRYDRPFNFSAINNLAVQHARGAVLCLLNNDTEVISTDWLEEMIGHLLQPRVGVAGAKLYYPDGRVQHAGDTVGPGGCANHLHSCIGRDDPGYCRRAVVAQELSAVTGACLVTWRELYLRLDGLDEKRLAVAFNDVDYCLRVRAAGFRVVWTPHAELYHHESVSRGGDASWRGKSRAKREVATMRRRWGHVLKHDPFYNPNLSYEQPDFSPSRAPRVKKPWPGVSPF